MTGKPEGAGTVRGPVGLKVPRLLGTTAGMARRRTISESSYTSRTGTETRNDFGRGRWRNSDTVFQPLNTALFWITDGNILIDCSASFRQHPADLCMATPPERWESLQKCTRVVVTTSPPCLALAQFTSMGDDFGVCDNGLLTWRLVFNVTRLPKADSHCRLTIVTVVTAGLVSGPPALRLPSAAFDRPPSKWGDATANFRSPPYSPETVKNHFFNIVFSHSPRSSKYRSCR